LVKYLAVTFSVSLPVEIKHPVPASQARFPQFRVTERFYFSGYNKRSDRGELYQGFRHFLLGLLGEGPHKASCLSRQPWPISPFLALRNLITLFHFPQLVAMGGGPSQED